MYTYLIYIHGIHPCSPLKHFWGSYKKLAWVAFEPMTTELRSDALTDWAIRPWVRLRLRANFAKLLQFYLLQWWIPYVSIHPSTNAITCARLCLKQMWRLTEAMAEMKCEYWTKRWNWSCCTKLALSASWTYGLIDQSVRASERNSVVVGSNPIQACSYFKNLSMVNTLCIDSFRY